MDKTKMDLTDEMIRVLREELEYVEGNHKDDTYYSQWVMAVALKETSKGCYLARTVIKTNQSPYVDGTDIKINIIDGEAELDLSFAEEEPTFQGGEIDSSIRFLEHVNNFCYMQPEDPFDIKDIYLGRLKAALDGYSLKDLAEYNSFDSHIRNIINLYKALLLDIFLLEVEDITVEGGEVVLDQYKLEIRIKDKEFKLDANNKHIKEDIIEEILNEIILPLVEADHDER